MNGAEAVNLRAKQLTDTVLRHQDTPQVREYLHTINNAVAAISSLIGRAERQRFGMSPSLIVPDSAVSPKPREKDDAERDGQGSQDEEGV